MMLRVEAMEAGYGEARVLLGVDLEVARGEVVALLGRNDMGKTTTVRGIFGLLPLSMGRVFFEGHDLTDAPPFVRAQHGLGLVPEGRQVFPPLTVEEIGSRRRRPASARPNGHCRKSMRCFRDSPSAGPISAISSRAASSRCWRSDAR